jgi:Family of unknown function (DUF5343)
MAEAPAYTTVPGKIPDLLKKIRETGVPSKANKAWLDSLGYRSSNDRSLVNVLRQVGFIDATGAPTPAWKKYRGADHKEVLGRAVQLGYADLYLMYPDAHAHTNTDLGHVFSAKTDAGKQAIDKMVSTFKSLAGQADFGSEAATVPTEAVPATATDSGTATNTEFARTARAGAGLNVNINVELTLPETTDEKVYEAFFRAMRKHLLSDDAT